jgi:hypothetical protein
MAFFSQFFIDDTMAAGGLELQQLPQLTNSSRLL